MRELLKETKIWRVSTEDAAVEMINEYKDKSVSEGYTVTKSGYTIKTKKSKGEIIDMWAQVEITFAYDI